MRGKMADLLQLFKGSLEFLQPSLEKISLAFFMLFVVFLGLLIDIPE